MAVIYSTGFEKQDLTAGVEVTSTVGSPTIDTTIKRSGAASLKCAATGSEVSVVLLSDTSDFGDFVRQIAIYVPTGGLPSSLTKIGLLSDSGGDHTSVRINSDGTLELWDDSAGPDVQFGSDSSAITLDAWNVIELDVGEGHGGNDLRVKLNGVLFAEGAASANGTNHFNSFKIGVIGAETATVYFDDIVVITHANGADFESWSNGIKLVMSLPNAAGDNAATAGLFSNINYN